MQIEEELSVIKGGEDLYYPMGSPVNVYEEPMQVEVDFGLLSNAAFYDKETNSISLHQSKLEEGQKGYYHVVIRASYLEPNAEVISFEKKIYIYIWQEP